jgi:hypothetical protein
MTKTLNLHSNPAGHFKYPAVTETCHTFPGARLAVGWGLEVVTGVECG